MHTNDLLLLLNKLSPKDIKKFHAYIKKQFKADSIPLRLFHFLRKNYPDFQPNKVSYEKAHVFLAPGKSFNKTLVSNNLSDIRIELKKYLVEQHLKKTPFQKDMILLEVYRQYQLDSHFNKQLNAMNKSLENTKQKDLWFWLKKMQLDHEKYFSMGTKKPETRWSVFSAMENLDRFHTAAKLRYSSEIYNGFQIFDEPEPAIRFLPEIEQTNLGEDLVYHNFYKNILQLIKTRSTDLYIALREMFFEKGDLLSKRDQFVIFTYLLNHTSFEIRMGKDDFVKESFDLIQIGVTKQLFIIDGKYDPNHFLNAIETAGRLEQFDWAERFITEWSGELALQTREYYVTLGNALLQFKKKDYNACSDILAQIDIKEPQDELRGRWLRIISLYEINSPVDFMLYQCKSFEKFIRHNRFINKETQKGVMLSVKVLRMLLKPKPEKNKIQKLLESGKSFYYKSWLEQKEEALK